MDWSLGWGLIGSSIAPTAAPSALPVAVVQHDVVWEDASATCTRLAPMVSAAVEAGARLVVLTEMFATGFSARTEAIAEPEGGPAGTFLAESAAGHGVWMLGSVCEWPPGGPGSGPPRNVALLAGPDGDVLRYAKRHLFSFAGEHHRLAAGDDQVVGTVDGLRVAPLICYDLRFADDFWRLAPEVDAYVVVANWPAERAEHWRSLLVARAIENQAWVVGANRIGTGGGLDYRGDSLVVDPMGAIVADGAGGREEVLGAVLDADRVREVRAAYPFLSDRR